MWWGREGALRLLAGDGAQASLAFEHFGDAFLQFRELFLLRPVVEAFHFALGVDQDEAFGVKLFADGLAENFSTDPSDVGQVAGKEQPLVFIGAESCRVFLQYFGCVGFGVD